jgi:hypothetical protein
MSLSVYQGWSSEMNTPRIQSVKPLKDRQLLVSFVNGIQKVYDCSQIIHLERFRLLKDAAFFNAVKVDTGGYGVFWDEETDLSEYELWHNGIEVTSKNFYAMNVQES